MEVVENKEPPAPPHLGAFAATHGLSARDALRHLFQTCQSYEEVAVRLNVSVETLRCYRHRYGLVLKRKDVQMQPCPQCRGTGYIKREE